jgi:hypothetical protein
VGPEPVPLRQRAEGHAYSLRGLHIRGLARVRRPLLGCPSKLVSIQNNRNWNRN